MLEHGSTGNTFRIKEIIRNTGLDFGLKPLDSIDSARFCTSLQVRRTWNSNEFIRIKIKIRVADRHRTDYIRYRNCILIELAYYLQINHVLWLGLEVTASPEQVLQSEGDQKYTFPINLFKDGQLRILRDDFHSVRKWSCARWYQNHLPSNRLYKSARKMIHIVRGKRLGISISTIDGAS